jgi:hypothetical protein
MVTSRPVLKKMIKETEASPEDSARQTKKAESKVQIPNENGVLRRQELQQYVGEVFKTIESVLESVRQEEATRRNREVQELHLQMEAVQIRLEQLIGRLETLLRQSRQEPVWPAETSCSNNYRDSVRKYAKKCKACFQKLGRKRVGKTPHELCRGTVLSMHR